MSECAAFLLDTNVVSEMMRPEPDRRVVHALELAALDGIGVTTVTIWEILNGTGRLPLGARRDSLRSRFQSLLDEAFDERACAELMERKRRQDEPLDDHLPDTMIAGTAVNRRLTVLTGNDGEFRNTGAAWVNPWTGLTDFVRQALAFGGTSMGRAAELLRVTREEMRELARRWVALS